MPKPQLFMFHFAGGNGYSFNFMDSYLKDFKIETIELPGRGIRSDEKLIKDFSSAAEDIYEQVKKKLNSNCFLIYGHSMGAILALKVTKMLEQDNLKPLSIILTGNAGPKIKESKKRYLLSDADFIKEVGQLGGLTLQFLENKELLDYFIPILKADFEISEENNLDSDSIVKSPIYAIMGDLEKNAAHISNWSNYTSAHFNYEIFSGDHFFIYNHAERLCSIIIKCYCDNLKKKENNFEALMNNISYIDSSSSILSQEDYRKIVYDWNRTDREFPNEKTIYELFEEQVIKTPNKIALVCQDRKLTYNELNEKSNQLANYLRTQYKERTEQLLKPDTLIALCIDKSLEMIIGILAILKAGGAYVPIDPSIPQDRVNFILEDTNVGLILTKTNLASNLTFPSNKIVYADLSQDLYLNQSKENLSLIIKSTDLAYVIYTSGTTGKPKGVLIEHVSVVNEIISQLDLIQLTEQDKSLLTASIVFDAAVECIFMSLFSGGCLYVVPDYMLLESAIISEYFETNKISVLNTTPSYLLSININLFSVHLRHIVLGGEAYQRIDSSAKIYNTYGPTETTIVSLACEINNEKVFIGKPIKNTKVYILNNDNQSVSIGEVGELHISGIGVARGYLNNPELTKELFVFNPFATEDDKSKGYSRLYKTGDLVRWLPDGNIEYLGRNDEQVKIRGYRIELAEIEHAISQIEGIKQVCVLAKDRQTETFSQKYLVGYYVLDTGDVTLDSTLIQDRLSEILPDYMIPSVLMAMESFPLTNNGKLDKQALPKPEFSSSHMNYVAPTTEIEIGISEIWQEVLGLDKVSIIDDFFRLGGNSILAIQVSHRMCKLLGRDIKVADVFKYKTIAELLLHTTCHLQIIIPKINANQATLSYAQERLWFIEQYEVGSNAYHIPEIYELDVYTNKEGIKYALQEIISRHEVLRTTIEQVDSLGQGIQIVHEKALIIEEVKLPNIYAYDLLVRKDINRPFNLSKEYPIRVKFYTIESALDESLNKIFLLINIHHIASDGWSTNIFENELFTFYEAYINKEAVIGLPALDIQYKDYAVWQRSYLTNEIIEKQLGYWREKLSGYQVLEFPTDFVRPTAIDYKGADYDFILNAKISKKLRELSQYYKVTLHSLLLSSINILLNKYTGQDDIVIGSLNANRQQSQTEGLIGFFVNAQVNRSLLNNSQTFKELVKQVQCDQIEAQLHQDLPFEKLVNDLGIERDTSRHPIFQILFGVQGFGKEDKKSELQKKYIKPYQAQDIYQNARFDLIITIDDRHEELLGRINFATSLFHKGTITRFSEHYLHLLEQLIETPEKPYSQFSLLKANEYNEIVYNWNATDKEYAKDKSIIDVFKEQVKRAPNNIAIVFEDKEVTYQQLDEESDKLASYLIENYDLQADNLIGIMLERSENMLIAIFGILKAGAAYVCIDPEYPAARKEYIVSDASLNILITQTDYIFDLEFYQGNIFAIDVQLDGVSSSAQSIKKVINPHDLAYVIYTSGTTGRPKGVMVEHRAILSLVCNDYIDLSTNDVFAFLSSPAFDASTFEIYTPLLNGNKLIIPKNLNTVISDINEFKIFLELNNISVLWLTKTLFDNLYYIDNNLFGNLNYLIIGGEALDKSTVNKLISGSVKPKYFLNGYGPTESTTFTCTYNITNQIEGQIVPIGKPINNRSVYILDLENKPVPVGVIGELYIGGDGLARGYLNHPNLTEEYFINNFFATESDKAKGRTRLYKTGDLGRWLPEGNIEYIGRIDNQVKIKGYRIELGEIEHAIYQIGGIKQVCVLAKEKKLETGNIKYLVAYYVLNNYDAKPDKTIILDNLYKVLPPYMIPLSLVEMELFPLTSNGKLDINALPSPDFNKLTEEFVAPITETEKAFCNIWQEVLGLQMVGLTDDFFRIGGDSILSIRLVSQIKELGFNISVQEIFKYKTINNLLPHIIKGDSKDEVNYKTFSLVNDELKNSILKGNNLHLDQLYDIYPASYLQSGMLVESLFDKKNDTYHDVLSYNITKEFNLINFERIWCELVDKYENLRSAFISNEKGYFSVIYKSIKIDCKIKLLSLHDNLSQIVEIEKYTNFNLTDAGIFRLLILPNYDNKSFVLVFSLHHAITDGWSVASIISEFVDAYIHKIPIRRDILPHYGKYIGKEMEALNNANYKKFWLDYLSSYELKSNKLILNDQCISSDQVIIDKEIGLNLSNKIIDFARELKISPDIVFLGVYNKVLSMFYSTDDLLIGTVINNRLEEEGGDKVFGLHLNTIPMRFKTENGQFKSVKDYFLEVLENKLKVNEYKLYPFGKIKSDLGFQEYIYQCAFNYVHFHITEENLDNQSVIEEYSVARTSIPLVLDVTRFQDTFNIRVEGGADFIENKTAEILLNTVISCLEQITSNVDILINDISLLLPSEHQEIVYDWNATDKDYPQDQTIYELFQAQAERIPESIALVYEGQELSYRELNERSNQLARHIRFEYQKRTQEALKADSLIGLCLDRGLEMIIGILAVLKSGGAYVPIDPEYPQERIDYILEDTGAVLVLSQNHVLEKAGLQLPGDKVIAIDLGGPIYDGQEISNLPQHSGAKNLAYVIYTSGTTGRPKGVLIEHSGAVNLVYTQKDDLEINDQSKVLQYASTIFDASVWEIFSALSFGGSLFILPAIVRQDTQLLGDYIEDNRINVALLPPVLLTMISPTDQFKCLEILLVGGDLSSLGLMEKWSKGRRLINAYGPTENSVCVTMHNYKEGDSNTNIGKPLFNMKAYVLDTNNQPVPVGVIGELHVGGAGLARGYLNREDLTAERFIPNSFATALDKSKGYDRLYKTGDMVRWLADGNLEYIGRNDDQVKIRGYRIELGEIEHALSSIAGISQSSVLVRERETSGGIIKSLVGYYVAEEGDLDLDQGMILEQLSAVLPEYMIPGALVAMDSFPLTINGKLDKRALPDPNFNSTIEQYVAPGTELETVICGIWQEVLGLERVGITDDFFKIGGNSILAIQISHCMSKLLESDVKVGSIFKFRTIKLLMHNSIRTEVNDENINFELPI
ncbi:amino acid adenylation domain-containing protein [Flavobacterium pectinovorum]|uniref:non-ribosomal peptide synthetase n=1 Tax=Flavobacterium pectinovorum TaxID=29533 RepID=UPI00265F055A|nr:non-ribosomal peptide synthetase [Flavobacterium pectinovorum]WKL50107.1 amino acid adenylation domain-containing protein [Flavobacterium pectinovorum]